MPVRLTRVAEQLRNSLFFVPMLFVLGGVALGLAGIEVDRRLTADAAQLPLGLSSTVESARSVLGTIAGATITVAGIAFSVSLLLIQQASSQYSPRIIHGFYRDPFNKRVMGIVVGTFTFCLVVLRSVRGPLDETGERVIPNLSVAVAVVLGIVSVLSIVSFISHSAHAMDVSTILEQATAEARRQAARLWPTERPAATAERSVVAERCDRAGDDVLTVTLSASGWIQQIDSEGLALAADPSGVVRAEVAPGRYAVPGTVLCTVVPAPSDPDAAVDAARRSVITGDTRTPQQDVTYGIRQMVDVALRALSPGINDPTTAQDAMFHLGGVLGDLLSRHPPSPFRPGPDDRIVVLEETVDHEELIELSFDEVRLASRSQPTVCIYLLELLHLLSRSSGDDAASGVAEALRRQADLVVAGVDRGLLDHDVERVRAAYRSRFGDGSAAGADELADRADPQG